MREQVLALCPTVAVEIGAGQPIIVEEHTVRLPQTTLIYEKTRCTASGTARLSAPHLIIDCHGLLL